MRRFQRKLATFILSLSLLSTATLFPHPIFAEGVTIPIQTESSSRALLDEVMQYIDQYNITGATQEQLVQQALKGMVSGLNDPYSQYFTPEERKAFESQLNLQYEGIGIETRFEDGKARITRVFDKSPAQTGGILKDDILVQVDGKTITEAAHIQKYILGKSGTTVNVTVNRHGKSLSFTLTRSAIHIPAVNSNLLDNHVGYIQLSNFTSDADEEFAEHLDQLQKKGMKSLILDLRDNPGGYVDSAMHIAEHFIQNGILMYTKDNTNKLQPTRIENGQRLDMPVILLVNKNSASASEILAGALRDNNVAKLVGTNTFGKGRIQSIFSLSDGGMLKLTTQQYVTPLLTDFNGKGLQPDVRRTGNAAQFITAMQLASSGKLSVTLEKNKITVGGAEISDNVQFLQKGSSVYVPTQILAALVSGQPEWVTSSGTLALHTSDTQSSSFTLASKAVLNEKGETFIDLHAFQAKFPSLQWSSANGKVTLSI
jgi:carboxyl-terminal processing protease